MNMKEQLKSVSIISGELFVTAAGALMMPRWCAVSLDTQHQVQLLTQFDLDTCVHALYRQKNAIFLTMMSNKVCIIKYQIRNIALNSCYCPCYFYITSIFTQHTRAGNCEPNTVFVDHLKRCWSTIQYKHWTISAPMNCPVLHVN